MENNNKDEQKRITFKIDKEKNFSEWFSEIVDKAELADLRYNIKGFVVFRPWAVIAMERMYDLFEQELQKKGHQPSWFPAVIPEKNFKLETKHVEGFIPEVFWVTHAASNLLQEKLAMRPTSETAMYQMYALWIRSYKDLPFKMYQRAQVWRYETKATRPFIRSREFYWIEAHDCFATKKQAEAQVQEDIQITEKVMHQKFGIPFLAMKRPEWDKFAGAVYTIGSDVLMPDGKLIQQPSTHLLGQHFSKVFDIKFRDEKGKQEYVWQTCYGPAISRIFASVIAIHGDNNGLILPYEISPIQVIIVPIFKEKEKMKIMKKAKQILNKISKSKIRVKIDERNMKPGEKYYFWEMKGVPLRIDIGKNEIKTKKLTLFKRDTKQKIKVSEKNILEIIEKEGKNIDNRLKKKSDNWFKNQIVNCNNKQEVKKTLQNKKIVRCNFCSMGEEGEKCAEQVEKKFLATVRGIRHDKKERAKGVCVFCGKKANYIVYIAKSY